MVKPIIKKLKKKGFEIQLLELNNYGRRRLSFISGRIGEVMHDIICIHEMVESGYYNNRRKRVRLPYQSCLLFPQNTTDSHIHKPLYIKHGTPHITSP